ncbi:MAG: RNA polymerase subunit sigma, partial [Planctomycetes bacterium]|nr:RNA polymerase subunit sigma [Planctomycetota bacterium]
VLWFDECYDEVHFRFDSAQRAAGECALLIIVGSTGLTNLPRRMAGLAAGASAALLVVDPASNDFTELAESYRHGAVYHERATVAVPAIVDHLLGEGRT